MASAVAGAGPASLADAGGDAEVELQQRLRRHPPQRYPVQHATAAFHLGVLRLDDGRHDDAVADLRRARELFPAAMPVERAKAAMMLGAALRAAGHGEQAAACFDEAVAGFADVDQPAEHGAALHNRGLAARDAQQPRRAADCFARAAERFTAAGAGPQRAAAARERGAALLAAGDAQAAREVLEDAGRQAGRTGDLAAQGETANLLGLARLAAGDAGGAAEAFQEAAAAHPPNARPQAYAMAKANLALAWQREGRRARGCLAARQALAAGSVPAAVGDQARGVLADGSGPGEALAALDAEPDSEWPAVMREEVARWAGADGLERDAESAAWMRGLAGRGARAGDLAEPWLGALLELPPAGMERVAAAAIRATGRLDAEEAARVRGEVARAMARFHAPQMLRLRDTFQRLAGELGEPAGWD